MISRAYNNSMSQPMGRCPNCGSQMEVRELWCGSCDITVRGRFPRCEFCALSDEHLQFLRLFVSRRGNLREVERELGVSYPTARARLDDLLKALGYAVSTQSAAERQARRRQILDDLKAGRISPEEAARALRE
jgi:hypothetical protein